MFHTLSELQEKEKNKGKPIPKNSFPTMPKEKSPEDNYYGKGNKAYDHYNKKPTESLNVKFEKTKNKITLIVFQNGFILNNGPFRDRAFKENEEFMEEVERGNIPHELIEKGIDDLGILLINRKSEIYHQPNLTPITQITQITQINPINPITINPNPNLYGNNSLNNLNNLDSIFNTYTYNNSFPYQYNATHNTFSSNQYNNLLFDQIFNPQPQIQQQNLFNQNNLQYNNINNNQYSDPFLQNISNFDPFEISKPRDRAYSQNINATPIGTRNVRNEIFIPNTENRNYIRRDRYNSSVPKKNTKSKFETFHNFKRMELIKEEEKKREKQKKKINKEKPEDKKEEVEEKIDEKKFTAFGGIGQAIGYINIEGLNIQKDLKNSVDIFKPICTINIRLFNGEIIKGEFNYTQTLRDVYYYVRKISGSNNFTLLDGFPPVALRDYDKTIRQLRLENTILTQRINS